MGRFFQHMVLPFLVAATLAGQTAPPREMVLVIGRGELLQFENDVKTVAVSEPKIADAVVISPREVMINAKGAGRATVVIWETGSIARRYDVTVQADAGDFDKFVREIRESVADGAVNVSGSGDTVVLTGSVKDPDQAKRAAALAQTRARNVVNLIQTPPPEDPKQILLEVKFASIDRAGLSELGLNLFSRNEKMVGATSTQQFQAPRFSPLQFQDQNTTLNFADLLNIFLYRPDLNIGATIRAMESRNLLQILAEPNLIAIEGTEASFLAGGEFPFPTLTSTSTGGAVAPVVTVQFKKFGVQLDFTPKVTPTGAIHLKVRPTVTALDFSNAVQLQGFLIPAISGRTAETEVILKDGESFAIAGLLDNRVVQTLSRIKGIGDLPIIGYLFRSRSTKKTSDELLVVVTPRFVRPLSPEEKAKTPVMLESFLPTAAEEKATREAKQKGKKAEAPKPEFVGPRGHQEPKP